MTDKITCAEFSNNRIKHIFLTKKISGSSHKYVEKEAEKKLASNDIIKKNHQLALNAFNVRAEKINVLNQIHSNIVVTLDHNFPFMQEPQADAMVTHTEGIVLGIITADCVPVLFADFKHNVIAAAHAGWRGARFGIITNTIREMKNLGAEQIHAVIGPCIYQDNYEVGPEFYENFMTESSSNVKYFINSPQEGHYKFDLPQYVIDKLQAENLAKIYNIRQDTFSAEEKFFSFRRTTLNKNSPYGSLISMITIDGD